MHHAIRAILLPSLALMLSLSNAEAAGKMKAGLWEMRMQSDAMKNMPKVPPEQLAKMKEMGLKMPMMQDGAMLHQVCISKEMAEQNHPPMAQREQSMCKPLNIIQSGNSYSMDLLCDGPELKGKGTITGSYNGAEQLRSVYDFKGTSRGNPVSQRMETTGKWLSADCGAIKPMTELAKPK